VKPPNQLVPKRDGNRYRRIRYVPCGLVAVRQRKLYDYGFQRGDDTEHLIQWLEERAYRRRKGNRYWEAS
jgi:hypothetical protein